MAEHEQAKVCCGCGSADAPHTIMLGPHRGRPVGSCCAAEGYPGAPERDAQTAKIDARDAALRNHSPAADAKGDGPTGPYVPQVGERVRVTALAPKEKDAKVGEVWTISSPCVVGGDSHSPSVQGFVCIYAAGRVGAWVKCEPVASAQPVAGETKVDPYKEHQRATECTSGDYWRWSLEQDRLAALKQKRHEQAKAALDRSSAGVRAALRVWPADAGEEYEL